MYPPCFSCATALWSHHLCHALTPGKDFSITPACPLSTVLYWIPFNSGQPSITLFSWPGPSAAPQSVTNSACNMSHIHLSSVIKYMLNCICMHIQQQCRVPLTITAEVINKTSRFAYTRTLRGSGYSLIFAPTKLRGFTWWVCVCSN